jgi:Zn-dependent peptidase ImmA (M78 family)/DNA-binding XRE family transcriptional regulator
MGVTINPAMITIARESRGMSQADLAEKMNISQGKLSKYENGLLCVSGDDLNSMSRVLVYTTDFFVQTDKIYGLGSSFLFNRKRKTAPVLVQRRIQAMVNILRMQVDRLLRAVEMAPPKEFKPIDIEDHDGDAEKIARLVRAGWSIPEDRPIASVTRAIEDAGGLILKCAFDTRAIDAVHLWLPDLPPLFFVNRDLPGDRLRWTLAHEIGHAIMHRQPTGDVEAEANSFASEFLLPRRAIERHLSGLNLQKAAVLKQEWKVSMAAIIMRARDLGCVTERKAQSLFMHLGVVGRIEEPFPIGVEEPENILKLVELHRRELGYNDIDLARLLFTPDPQFFSSSGTPTLLHVGDEPFFAFIAAKPHERRLSM